MRRLIACVLFLAGCGDDAASVFDGGGVDATTSVDGGGADVKSDAPGFGQDGAMNDGNACNPPDMLIVLDHTDSMADEPNGAKPPLTDAGLALSKWVLACDAVTAVTAPPTDQTLRFGLELFPLDPDVVTDAGGKGHCQTLAGLVGGMGSTNSGCMPAEVPVPPALNTGSQIGSLLDPYALRLCVTTPIHSALQTAQSLLQSIAVSGRPQYIVLVTDGGETCVADTMVVAVTQAIAAAGIQTYVVGFGAADAGSKGVNVALLNNLACAGMTATGFGTACVQPEGSAGYVAVKPGGPPIFFLAEDGASVQTALTNVTKNICCGCVH